MNGRKARATRRLAAGDQTEARRIRKALRRRPAPAFALATPRVLPRHWVDIGTPTERLVEIPVPRTLSRVRKGSS